MKNITTRQYQILKDHMAIYEFMLEIYERDWRNGVPAPFLEYALSSTWMDKSYSYLNRIWFDGDKIVAYVFNESPVTDIYFSLRPGYEALAPEMIAYAEEYMPNFENKRQFVLFKSQKALVEAARAAGYKIVYEFTDMQYDYKKPLDYKLPEGYRFVPPEEVDTFKQCECCWKGFNHEADKGPWKVEQDIQVEGSKWTPANALKNSYQVANAPHLIKGYDVIIEDEKGEYVCYAGMWWIPENHLAYMEPLCTVPEHRHKGLAAAALSELYRRMKPLGATHMTGGDNPFYAKIGYEPMEVWTYWKKEINR